MKALALEHGDAVVITMLVPVAFAGLVTFVGLIASAGTVTFVELIGTVTFVGLVVIVEADVAGGGKGWLHRSDIQQFV